MGFIATKSDKTLSHIQLMVEGDTPYDLFSKDSVKLLTPYYLNNQNLLEDLFSYVQRYYILILSGHATPITQEQLESLEFHYSYLLTALDKLKLNKLINEEKGTIYEVEEGMHFNDKYPEPNIVMI